MLIATAHLHARPRAALTQVRFLLANLPRSDKLCALVLRREITAESLVAATADDLAPQHIKARASLESSRWRPAVRLLRPCLTPTPLLAQLQRQQSAERFADSRRLVSTEEESEAVREHRRSAWRPSD